MNGRELAFFVAGFMNNKKVFDVDIIDISTKSSFADYFVLGSCGSQRQVEAISEDIKELLESKGVELKSIDGRNGSGWVILDFNDIIVNVFTEDMRDRYSLEKVWADCGVIRFNDETGEVEE